MNNIELPLLEDMDVAEDETELADDDDEEDDEDEDDDDDVADDTAADDDDAEDGDDDDDEDAADDDDVAADEALPVRLDALVAVVLCALEEVAAEVPLLDVVPCVPPTLDPAFTTVTRVQVPSTHEYESRQSDWDSHGDSGRQPSARHAIAAAAPIRIRPCHRSR